MTRLRFILLFFCLLSFTVIKAQQGTIICKEATSPSNANLSFPMISTSGTFRMLVVYCKFKDDNFDLSPFTDLWPSSLDTLPEWTKETISPIVMQKYHDPSISGFFKEMSSGKLDLIGDVCPIVYIPQHEESYYYYNNGKNLSFLTKEILDGIDPYVNFANYDNNGDGIVDMIAICFRAVKDFGKLDYRWGRYQGTASMTGSYTRFDNLDSNPASGFSELVKDGVKIRPGFGGSGTIQNNIYDPEGQLSVINHELGHYFFGYAFNGNIHLPGTHHHGLMDTNLGGSVMNAYERELLGWISPKMINSDQKDLIIKDAVNDGDIYKIHTSKGDYYIENHEGKSYYENTWKYYNGGPKMQPGKGLIITKVNRASSTKYIDIKSASGNWNWKTKNGLFVYPFEKDSPNSSSGTDELTMTALSTTAGTKNHPDYMGAATDYFNLGYNQVISPWSNPQIDSDTNIAIELKGYSGNDIKVDFYFSNPAAGSPSKPQNLKVTKASDNHPILSWTSNSEPDVISGGKYSVYKSFDNDSTGASYKLIATVIHNSGSVLQSFEDKSESLNIESTVITARKIYYKVTAIDNTSLESVKSDPMAINDTTLMHSASLVGSNRTLVTENQLSNNYPNPFNPSTQISYYLKEDGLVTLHVYDILGNRIAELVNEKQQAGSHKVTFDGSGYPSGVYIYKIQCGNYSQSKKMTLIK